MNSQDSSSFDLSIHECSISSSGRSVAFSDTEFVIELPCRTPQELEDLWYSEEEYYTYKRDCARTLAKMRTKSSLDADECCERGLENMSQAGKILRKSRYDYCVKVVMEEQASQRGSPLYDFELFREASEKAARKCVQIAASRARHDALEAR